VSWGSDLCSGSSDSGICFFWHIWRASLATWSIWSLRWRMHMRDFRSSW
jgi:hypothetical protein